MVLAVLYERLLCLHNALFVSFSPALLLVQQSRPSCKAAACAHGQTGLQGLPSAQCIVLIVVKYQN